MAIHNNVLDAEIHLLTDHTLDGPFNELSLVIGWGNDGYFNLFRHRLLCHATPVKSTN
jgi:hypothetical protein